MHVEWTTSSWRVSAHVDGLGEMTFDVRQLDSGADGSQLRELVDLIIAALEYRPMAYVSSVFDEAIREPEPEPEAPVLEIVQTPAPSRPKRKYVRRKPVGKAAKRTPTRKTTRRKSPRRKTR